MFICLLISVLSIVMNSLSVWCSAHHLGLAYERCHYRLLLNRILDIIAQLTLSLIFLHALLVCRCLVTRPQWIHDGWRRQSSTHVKNVAHVSCSWRYYILTKLPVVIRLGMLAQILSGIVGQIASHSSRGLCPLMTSSILLRWWSRSLCLVFEWWLSILELVTKRVRHYELRLIPRASL